MRRGFPLAGAAVMALLASVVVPAGPSGAVDERPRTAVLLRIADLSDDVEMAQARVQKAVASKA